MHLLLADDHGLFRDCMAIWLKQLRSDLHIDFADSLSSAIASLERTVYDLVLMDLGMPGMLGVVSIRQVCSLAGPTPLLVVSADDRPHVVSGCVDAGAAGYVTKASSGKTILLAVQRVLAGGQYFPAAQLTSPSPELVGLSDKQKQVLAYLAEGHSNRTIARNMCLSESTVKQYVSRILEVLGVDNRMQAGLKAKALLGMADR